MYCRQCQKSIEMDGTVFCPYCGSRLVTEETGEAQENEAKKWLTKALAVTSFPERKKILQQGLQQVPDSKLLQWELLFIGEPVRKPPKGRLDYSIIKCWILQIYLKPEEFTPDEKTAMREKLFDDPQLNRTAAMFGDPEKKKEEYLERICRDYIAVFMEEDNRLMGSIFGFKREKNREKYLAGPAADMIRRMKTDDGLTADQREQLANTFYRAFSQRMNGKTAFLDEALQA
ncbi:MAG: zinc ribbon domain-containing protein [Clostridia bacterium]|nr:zinc ribbon domain-containing protein [Clostridia bacterium]